MSPEEDKVRPFNVSPPTSILPPFPPAPPDDSCPHHFPKGHLDSPALRMLFPLQVCPSLSLELKEGFVSSPCEQTKGAGPAETCPPWSLVKMQILRPCPLRFCFSRSEMGHIQVGESL